MGPAVPGDVASFTPGPIGPAKVNYRLNVFMVLVIIWGTRYDAGTGVKKIQALGGFRACGYIALHRKPIRDMAFHLEQSDLLLTVALDKTAKLANVQNDMAVHTYQCDAPLWSCAWNGDNKSQFFVGTQTGKVSTLSFLRFFSGYGG